MTIETVFLDAGGVLVWPNWSRVAGALQRQGVTVDADQLRNADPPARFALDQAHIIGASTDQRRAMSFFDLVLAHAGVEASSKTAAALDEVRAYHRVENLWEVVPDFVLPAVRQLRSDGYKITIVSNANGTLHHLFNRLGLTPLFDVILDSQVEGVEKPDRRFFELALSRSNARPETTIHAGDFLNIDVAGARGARLHAVLIDESDLYRDADCPRIRSVAELPGMLRPR